MSDKFWTWITLLSSTTNITSDALAMNNVRRLAWEVTFPDNSTAGTVIIEQSSDAGYAGLWQPIGSSVWAAELTKLGGTAEGPFGFVRARLTLQAGTHTDPIVVKIQGMQ